ncbi:MAG TPA: helix-turn-helix transcriptional regulator [Polyangia bacterium]|nr:helix-turn-helix transcriptional regulator [Polyangia bacterium]
MDREALKGHLDVLLLAVIEPAPLHGYAIIVELRRRSRGTFDLSESTVYPALHRLEAAGLLRSSWATENGRQRRVYTLTAQGRKALRAEHGKWRAFALGMNAVLQGGSWTKSA